MVARGAVPRPRPRTLADVSDVADLPLIGAAALRARAAARVLRTLPTDVKDAALAAMADALVERTDEVLAANAADVAAAAADGTPESVLDRLRLDAARVAGVADALRHWSPCPTRSATSSAGRACPTGCSCGRCGCRWRGRHRLRGPPERHRRRRRAVPQERQRRAAARSASAFGTNTALVAVLTEAAEKAGLPAGSVELLPADRASVGELLNARGLVDVVIPRGGASLIERIVRESTVPVIETGVGNCHVYVDASADPAMAEAIVLNSKTHRVSVCNSAETLLVHRDVPFLPRLLSALADAGVTLHGDAPPRAATTPSSRRPTRTGRRSTCRWTWRCGWSMTCPRRWSTSPAGGPGTPRRSSRTRPRRSPG